MSRTPGTLSVALAISVGAVVALHGAKPPAVIRLLVSFDNGPSNALHSDSLSAPGYAADYADGLENVATTLESSGNFRLQLQANTGLPASRSMCFDFGSQSVPFAAAQCVPIQQPMHSFPTGDQAIQSLRYGQSVRKLTRFTWDDGALRYRIGYGTDMDVNGVQDSPAVTVACIAPPDSTKPCTRWLLKPESNGSAALFRFALTTGKRGAVIEGPAEFIGTYTMPFVQTLMVKN